MYSALTWKLDSSLPFQLSAVKNLFVARCVLQEPYCSQYVVVDHVFESYLLSQAVCFGKKSVVHARYTSMTVHLLTQN